MSLCHTYKKSSSKESRPQSVLKPVQCLTLLSPLQPIKLNLLVRDPRPDFQLFYPNFV